jgi:threonine dehydrogenase-like Zn-dependent dehydrogenase
MPKRMAITGPYEVEVREYEDAPLEPKQVRVRTELASGKHGTTMGMFDGINMRGQIFDPEMRFFRDDPDYMPPPPDQKRQFDWHSGTSGVGTVEEIGSEVTRWKVGDRVFGHMDVRETNTCHEASLWPLGDIEPQTALCIEPGYVSFHCVRESNVRYGDSVAVVGLGAIGMIAVEMVRASGAEKVFAVDPLPRRREWALKNGADEALDPMGEEDVAMAIHERTDGKGVDIAMEISGAYPALQTALRCVRMMGTVCSAGFYQGEAKGVWLGREWHHNRLTMVVPHGCGWGHEPRDYPNWDARRANDVMVGLMRKKIFRCPGIIDPIVPIEEGQKVFTLMRDDPNQLLKYGVRF